jgi:proline iminopeptidase
MNRRDFLKAKAAALLGLSAFNFGPRVFGQKTNPVASEVKTGGVRMIEIDGGFRVWTKRVGRGNIKMLLLHGGPGATHEYFECFEDFLPAAGVEFYYYDQLGSHYSDQPKDDALWRVERFVEEVEQVRRGLGLDKFYLLGHSWGGMLGLEYALKYQPHLKGLVISNMTASMAAYEKYTGQLRRQLPASVTEILDKYEAKEDYENSEYLRTMSSEVYSRHLIRLNPMPDPLERAVVKHFNSQVYQVMQGPNEFVITGNMKHWDRWADLPKIKTPTLVAGAKYDTMNPGDLEKMARAMPSGRFALCENGSHLAMYDDQEAYFQHLLKFIRDNERAVRI